MSTYNETLRFLYNLELFGIKVGLRNIKMLLSYLGHPEDRYPCIHIAGTNGKGSTAAMIASILTASGYKTGLYTSPHLIRFGERIRVDGVKIPDHELVHYANILRPAIEKSGATFFEATTAIAFQYFAEQQIDIAVIETGLGGRLDATNVVTPLLSIVTSIGLDHTEYLGRTHAAIAFEKGGIIKKDVPCLTAVRRPAAMKVLGSIARTRHAALIKTEDHSSVRILSNSLNGLTLDLATRDFRFKNLEVALAGEHQAQNCQLALLAVGYLQAKHHFSVRRGIRPGLADIRRIAGFRGRLDVLSHRPLVVADVCHNPEGVQTALKALRSILLDRFILLFGVMKDKDYGTMIRELFSSSRLSFSVHGDTTRALRSSEIAARFHKLGGKAWDGKGVSNGLAMALKEQREGEALVILGSHHVVGEGMGFLGIPT